MTGKRPLIYELQAAHLVAGHVAHVGNHNYNMSIGELRRASKKVNNGRLAAEHEALWDRLNREVSGLHILIRLSWDRRKVDPQIFDIYGRIQELLDRVHEISDKIHEKHSDLVTDSAKENLRLGKEVHKTLVKVINQHAIVKDYHIVKPETPAPEEAALPHGDAPVDQDGKGV